MSEENPLFCKNRHEWRQWLKDNYDTKEDVWLAYFKKHTGKETVTYKEAVEEAICFGWIDSKVKSINDTTYMQRYTPRRPSSNWSDLNKMRAEKMINAGKMTPNGMNKIEMAKHAGTWYENNSLRKNFEIPSDLQASLKANPPAWENFTSFAEGYQQTYLSYIDNAKQTNTRKRRIEKVVQLSITNQKSAML